MRVLSHKKKSEFLALVAYEFVIGFVALSLGINALWYLLLSWVIPTLFLLYKLHRGGLGYIFEALLWSVPMTLIGDWIGHYTRAWSYWDNPLFASTGISIVGIPIESFIWGSLFWIFTVVLYEYFFDRSVAPNFGVKEKVLAFCFTVAGLAAVLLINTYEPAIPFFYLLLLLIMVTTASISIFPYRQLVPRIVLFGVVVFVLGLQVEYFSLKLGLWDFPDGDFLAEVMFFGYLIPLEEILYWLIAPMAVASVHEIFADNKK